MEGLQAGRRKNMSVAQKAWYALRDALGSLLREACLALRLLQRKPPQPPLLSNWDRFLGPSSRCGLHTSPEKMQRTWQLVSAAIDAMTGC